MLRRSTERAAAIALTGVLAAVLLIKLLPPATGDRTPRDSAAPPPSAADPGPPRRRGAPPEAIVLPRPPAPPRPTAARAPNRTREAAKPDPMRFTPLRPSPSRPAPRRPEFTPLRPKPVEVERGPAEVAKAIRPRRETVRRAAPGPRAPVPPRGPRAARTPKSDASPEPVVVEEADIGEGRALLRILEHGAGPTIEIAWPDAARRRELLYRTFRRCYGMRLALMDATGGLYVAEGARRRPWAFDLDRYSGFVRQSAGQITGAERRQLRRIRDYHGGVAGASSVRLFPRRTDAVLLAALRRMVGPRYGRARTIRAAYRIAGNGVVVGDVRVDGRNVAGRIDLLNAASAACRAASRR